MKSHDCRVRAESLTSTHKTIKVMADGRESAVCYIYSSLDSLTVIYASCEQCLLSLPLNSWWAH